MIEVIEGQLKASGLRVRGLLHPLPEDGAPEGVGTLILIGFLGGELWPVFQKERRDEPHPLDRWTQRVIAPLAEQIGAVALYPFTGPPWLAFQRWAMTAEGLRRSPIGPLIHPVFGPWHGYRAALGLAEKLDLPALPAPIPVCDSCPSKPCLKACPTNVFAGGGYDVPKCAGHLRSPGNACMAGGCLARRACPVGAGHAYSPQQGGFHTSSFLRSMDSFG